MLGVFRLIANNVRSSIKLKHNINEMLIFHEQGVYKKNLISLFCSVISLYLCSMPFICNAFQFWKTNFRTSVTLRTSRSIHLRI